MRSFSAIGENCRVTDRAYSGKATESHAIMGAIGSNSGKMLFHMKRGYFNSEDFIEFITALVPKQIYKRKRLLLFLDNASIHRSKESKAALAKLKVPYVWNIPYKP